MLNISSIPAPRVPLSDPRTGLIAREWYRWFINVFTLLGSGTTDTSIITVEDNLTEQQFMLMGG